MSRAGGISGNHAASDGMEVSLGVDLAERGTLTELAAGVRPRTPNRDGTLTESAPLHRSGGGGGGGGGGGELPSTTTAEPSKGVVEMQSPMSNGRLSHPISEASMGMQAPGTAPRQWMYSSRDSGSPSGSSIETDVIHGMAALHGGKAMASLSAPHERRPLIEPPPGAADGGGPHCHYAGSLDMVGALNPQPHHHHGGGSRHGRVSFITAVLMGVALCFHSLLEGAAMGAQETISNSLHIFIAIVSHKGLAAYALGSSIVESSVG